MNRTRSSVPRTTIVLAVAWALVLAACSSGNDADPASDGSADGSQPTATASATEPTADASDVSAPAVSAAATVPVASDTETSEGSVTADVSATIADDPNLALATLGPPDGDPIVVGLSNTEGAPGLDFPDIREAIEGGVAYLNEHGGIGGRPITLEACVVNGSPEASQACAQELTGKGVELVILGLDLFADHATYTAAGTPVVGVLPVLPGDYSANARFLTGGNLTVMTAIAVAADEHFGATRVGIVSADNPGSNSGLAALTAALDSLGIEYTSVKGGDNETDAGFQGLVREAASGDPDLLVSLYADAGCIGMMRARVSLAIDTPVLTTGICSSTEVLEQVGDDAVGWHFAGASANDDSPQDALVREIMAPVLGVDPADVDRASLGLGALGLAVVMSVAVYGNDIAATDGDVTGASIYEYLNSADDLELWPGNAPIECGAAPAYPSICTFTFPFAEYVDGGDLRTIEGLELLSVRDRLP